MMPYMVSELASYLDKSENYYFINVTTGGYGLTVDIQYGSFEYYCGLLNSRLLNFIFKNISTNFRGGYFAANKQFIEQLPMIIIDFSNPKEKIHHDRMVSLVDSMLILHKQLATAKTPHEKTGLERQIAVTDQQIDGLVYQLYGLTDEEIAIVEAAVN
jgi:hypothetical protein